jgi:transaldolase
MKRPPSAPTPTPAAIRNWQSCSRTPDSALPRSGKDAKAAADPFDLQTLCPGGSFAYRAAHSPPCQDQHAMKFFVDTADTAEIADMAATGLLDGVTTNPSLIAKAGRDFLEVTAEICRLTDGPVSAEVVALDHAGMMREAEILRKIADNVCIKVPLTIDGLKTCKALTSDGTMVNVTLCFSAAQALLAAKAGATFVSPFVGRHDDNGFDGMALIADIRLIYDNYNYQTEILVASIRHGIHVLEAARIGADVITAPPAVIKGLFRHVLTEKGIEGFLADWAKTGQSIG